MFAIMIDRNRLIDSIRIGLDKILEKEMEARERIENYAGYSGERFKRQLLEAQKNLEEIVKQRKKYQKLLDDIINAVIKDL